MEIKREGVRVYRGRRRERWDDWELTNMWRAVEGTRTSTDPPLAVSVFSGDVPNEFTERRLLRERSIPQPLPYQH